MLEGKKGCPKILSANLGMRGFRAKLVSFTISLDPFRAFWCRVELQMTYSFSASEMCLQNGIKTFLWASFSFFTDQRRSFRGASFVSAKAACSKHPSICNIHIRRLPPPEKIPYSAKSRLKASHPLLFPIVISKPYFVLPHLRKHELIAVSRQSKVRPVVYHQLLLCSYLKPREPTNI